MHNTAIGANTRQATGPRAGFWRRFGAALVDGIIVGLIGGILIGLLRASGEVLAIALSAGYYTYCEGGRRGQTLGKHALAIRVIDLDSGGPIGYGRAFIRYLGRIVSSLVFYLGYLWMLWDPERQCWHDKFARDVVVPESAYPVL